MRSTNANTTVLFFLLIPLSSVFIQLLAPATGIQTMLFPNYSSSGFQNLIAITITVFLAFPTSLTSFLASFFAFRKFKDIKNFITYWLGPCVVSIILHFFLFSLLTTAQNIFSLFLSTFANGILLSILPSGIAGASSAVILKRLNKRKLFFRVNPSQMKRIFLMAGIFGLSFTFLTGIFVGVVTMQKADETTHYYLHRGIPFVFSGASSDTSVVPFPLIRIPIFSDVISGVKYVKLVHFFTFLLSLSFYILLSLVPMYFISTVKMNRKQFTTLLAFGGVFLLLCYYFWGQIVV